MIRLTDFMNFWRDLAPRVPGAPDVLPVTIDSGMGKKIQALSPESLTLFVFPLMADSAGSRPDRFVEESKCAVFLMKKYNPQKVAAFTVLEETQPAVEAVKAALLGLPPCAAFSVDPASFETAPETELYGTFAGWSITFIAREV